MNLVVDLEKQENKRGYYIMNKFDELALDTVRDIVFIETITNESARDIVRQISLINHVDNEMERATNGLVQPYNREDRPIVIRLSTQGGSVYAGLTIATAIKTSVTPVLVIASGIVASMGLYIMASAHTRIADESAEFMYHQVASGNEGKLDDHRQHLETLERLQKKYDSFLVNRSNGKLTQEVLNEKRDRYHDSYFTAHEALEFGLIDGVITDEDLYNPQMSPEEMEEAVDSVTNQLNVGLAQLSELTGERFKIDVIKEEVKKETKTPKTRKKGLNKDEEKRDS